MAEHHKWGLDSKTKIESLDARLAKIVDDTLRACPFDVKVVWGFRDQEAQEMAYSLGTSMLRWPDSKHNQYPSSAVDLAPIVGGRIPWKDVRPWLVLAGVVHGIAQVARVPIRWGGNWDRDEVILDDQSLDDLGHFELVDK